MPVLMLAQVHTWTALLFHEPHQASELCVRCEWHYEYQAEESGSRTSMSTRVYAGVRRCTRVYENSYSGPSTVAAYVRIRIRACLPRQVPLAWSVAWSLAWCFLSGPSHLVSSAWPLSCCALISSSRPVTVVPGSSPTPETRETVWLALACWRGRKA